MTALQTVAALEAFGARITIRASASIIDDLKPRLPPGARLIAEGNFDTAYTITAVPSGSESEPTRYELARDGLSMGSSRRLSKIRMELESDMHIRIACSARGYLFVHAGVVEWHGRAIVLPGPTMSGKSSLVMALVQAGARYYSDEFAVMDPNGNVRPYAKHLSERREGRRPRLHSPEGLGASPAHATVPLGLTAVLRFRRAAPWNPRPISRAEAMTSLFANTVSAQINAEFALSVLSRALPGSHALSGERGEAMDIALDLLQAQRPPRKPDTRGRASLEK